MKAQVESRTVLLVSHELPVRGQQRLKLVHVSPLEDVLLTNSWHAERIAGPLPPHAPTQRLLTGERRGDARNEVGVGGCCWYRGSTCKTHTLKEVRHGQAWREDHRHKGRPRRFAAATQQADIEGHEQRRRIGAHAEGPPAPRALATTLAGDKGTRPAPPSPSTARTAQ